MLPAWTFEWYRYLWPCTQMLISMCYLGIAVGWIHCLLWGSLSLESAFDGSREWREQDRREAFCTNTSQWEHVSHQNYKKNPLGLFDEETEQKWFWRDKGRLVYFSATVWYQPPILPCHYSFPYSRFQAEKWNFAVILYVITMNSCNSSAWRETRYWVEFSDHEKLSMHSLMSH